MEWTTGSTNIPLLVKGTLRIQNVDKGGTEGLVPLFWNPETKEVLTGETQGNGETSRPFIGYIDFGGQDADWSRMNLWFITSDKLPLQSGGDIATMK